MVLLALGACTGDHPAPPRPPEAVADPLGCELDPVNTLRIQCWFSRDGTGPIEAHVTPADGDPAGAPDGDLAVFAGDPGALSGDIGVWDLLGETRYDWALVDRGQIVDQGTLETEAAPPHYSAVLTPVIDGPSSSDRTLVALGCSEGSVLVAVDREGRVRWYQETGDVSYVAGFDATDRGTVVANIARIALREWAADGTVLTDLSYPDTLPRVVHHAVLGRSGRLLVLDTAPVRYPDGVSYLIDGVTAIEDGVATHVWDVGQVLDPQGLRSSDPMYWAGFYPGSVDFGHANSIDETADGGWLLSFKHLHSVVKIDPAGAVQWWIAGDATDARFDGPELALGSTGGLDASFQHQHHVTETPSGTILVFDNGRVDETSRVIELAVDEGAGAADVVREWELGMSCPVQSSAFLLPDGTLLATCATGRTEFEFGEQGLRRQVGVSCGDGGLGGSFIRAEPALELIPPGGPPPAEAGSP